MSTAAPVSPVNTEAPLDNFSQCHAGIVSQLNDLACLPEWLAAAERARQAAEGSLNLFKHGVYEHHADEERELFPAVLRSAAAGEELAQVESLVAHLTAEHRSIEALWKRIEPALRDAAKGRPVAALDNAVLAELVKTYLAHAQLEEEQFLPLAARILGRNSNHMAALGLSLHLRHAPLPMAHL